MALRRDSGQTRISTLVISCCTSRCVASTRKKTSFDIKDFAWKILLALILLGEATGSKSLVLKKIEKFFQEIYNP